MSNIRSIVFDAMLKEAVHEDFRAEMDAMPPEEESKSRMLSTIGYGITACTFLVILVWGLVNAVGGDEGFGISGHARLLLLLLFIVFRQSTRCMRSFLSLPPC